MPESFQSHVPAIAASAVGTVGCSVLGSYLGTAGTIYGLALGSIILGVLAWFAERAIRRSVALAKAKTKAVRSRGGRPLTMHETQIITAQVRNKHRYRWSWRAVLWVIIPVWLVSFTAITVWEVVANKPVTQIIYRTPPPRSTTGPSAPETPAPLRRRRIHPSITPTVTSIPPTPSTTPPSPSPTVSETPPSPTPTTATSPAPTSSTRTPK